MSTKTVTLFFALLALACNAFVVIVAGAWLLRRRAPEAWATTVELFGPSALTLGAVIAITATAGSLYLSEVAHFLPCRLCWYQRIGMYPLAVILTIAAIRKDIRAWLYPFALAVGALPISIYHVLLEHFPSLETGACDPNNPCSIVWTRHFGVVTIPYMAASGFAAIATCTLLAARWHKENSCRIEEASSLDSDDANTNASSSTASSPVS
jgi:disulfide bond formation protein DsbB